MSTNQYAKYEAIPHETPSAEHAATALLTQAHHHESFPLKAYPGEGRAPGDETHSGPPSPSVGGTAAPRRRPWDHILTWFEDSWVLEATASLFSTAVLACMVVILAHYNGRRQPEWSHISLNTVVAVLGTTARGSIVLITSRALGQMKWIWFTQQRRALSDLKGFDDASRGAFGSLQVLWSPMCTNVVALTGCLIMILSVAFDPFLQNLVRTIPQAVFNPDQPALLANTSTYTALGAFQGGSEFYVDPVMKANVYDSLLDSDPLQSWSIPQYSCNSGNCTWPPHNILAASYACNDITSSLTKNCTWTDNMGNCTIGLPGEPPLTHYLPDGGGQVLAIASADSNLSSFGSLDGVSRWAVLHSVTADVNRTSDGAGAITEQFSNATTYTATECIIFPCARRVSANLTNNSYYEAFHSFHNANTNTDTDIWTHNIHNDWKPGQPYPMQVAYQPPPWPAGTNASNRSTLGMDDLTHRSIMGFMYVFSGNVLAASDVFFFNGTGRYASADVLQAIYYSSMSGCTANTSALECAVRNTAKAITKTLRDSAYVANGQERANMTMGQTLVEVPVIQIEWVWLCLPLLVWALTIGFWIVVAVRTRAHHVPLWRSNLLPLLFVYGERNDEKQMDENQNTSARTYNVQARHLSAQLERVGMTVRLR